MTRNISALAMAIAIVITYGAFPGYSQFEPRTGKSLEANSDVEQMFRAVELQVEATLTEDLIESDLPDLTSLAGESRGFASSIYPKVAPSVVVVRSGSGHGTGVIVHEDGWILTNHHVIASAGIDFDTCARMVHIHFGEMKDNRMQMSSEVVTAKVYRSDAAKDLALLKLDTKPENLKPITMAEQNGIPGDDCFTVGHPARGLFWAVRSGELAGEGTYPNDLIDNVIPTYAMSGDNKSRWEEGLRNLAQRRMFISTCGLNPGDSGGPLMNTNGELIALNFAIPKMDKEKEVNYDKFSYHVHLDEIKTFMQELPTAPEVYCPSHWPPATISSLRDTNKDDCYETWEFLNDEKTKIYGIAIDVNQDTPSSFVEEFSKTGGNQDVFEGEFVINTVPQPRTYFDTDNDGTLDLCLLDIDGDWKSDLTLSLIDGNWTRSAEIGQFLTDPKLFSDPELSEQFAKLAEVLFTRNQPEKTKDDGADIKNTKVREAASTATAP